MSEINWGFIKNGHNFEALVTTLIRHKDPKVRIYERLGPDAGIDAKSGDSQTAYQAKYTKQDNFSQPLGTAKKEIDKIKKYKNPDHKNYKYWKHVKNWVFFTNASCNPSDEEKWKKQVEKPLKDICISACLKHKADIEQYLREYPDVKNEFFGGQNRVLLSLSEAMDTFKDNRILAIGLRISFKERKDELNNFMKFIKESNTQKVINIHGPGGVGKTRFVMEATLKANHDEEYDIFWANTATMEKSDNWFQAITTGRKSVLVIDEPTERKMMEILLEQVRSLRLSKWKYVVIARTVKEPVLKALDYRISNSITTPIEIKPLNKEERKQMFLSFLESSAIKNCFNDKDRREELSRYISKASDGLPVWIAVAAYLLEADDDIMDLSSQDRFGLAEKYIEEFLSLILRDVRSNILLRYLKSIAILQPVNIEDDPEMYEHFKTLLGNDIKKSELEKVFKHLQKKNFASKRGRLLEIKPDIIRDYIVFNYIGDNVSESKEWLEKLFQLKNPEKIKSALVPLAKVAFYKRYKKEDQNNNFFDEVWNMFVTESREGDVEKQYGILELASAVSFANPIKFLEVVKAIRDNKKEKKFFENTNMYLSHNHLIVKLPEAVYDAGKYVLNNEEAQQIFKELLELFRMENSITDPKIHFLREDERKSLGCIKNLMKTNDQELRYKYKNIILKWVKKELSSINQITYKCTLKLVKSITEDFFKIQREEIEVDGLKFRINFSVTHPESEDQKYINQIMTVIWDQLNKSNTDPKKRVLLWQLISFYQNQICHAEKISSKKDQKKYKSFWEKETKGIFQTLKKYISRHKLDNSEIKSLKSIWDWHLEYDKRPDIKTLVRECEKLTLKKSITYQYIKPLYEDPNYYPERKLIEKYVNENSSSDKLEMFIDNCFRYDYEEQKKYQDIFYQVAGELVHNTEIPPYAVDYINKTLREVKDDHHFQFMCWILFYKAGSLRTQSKDEVISFLNKYWIQLKSEKQKELFLNIVFSHAHPASQGLMTKQDIEFMFKILNSDNKLSLKNLYLTGSFAGRVIFSDFTQSKDLISNVFEKVDLQNTTALFEHYVKGIEHRLIFEEKYPVSKTENIFLWLIDLLSSNVFSKDFMDDIGFCEDNVRRIKQNLNARFLVKDYVCFLKKRLSFFEEKKKEKQFLWNNPLLEINFLKMVEPVNQKDTDTEDALNTLLDFNGSEILFYRLPKMVKIFDPEGFYIPKMIIKRIKDRKFLCETLKDDTPEYEWTRYAQCYFVNSKAWRKIAELACKIASQKSKKEKEDIFSSLMNYDTEFYKGRPGEVPQLFYDNVSSAEKDFKNEKDENIKEFMKWRWSICKARLESEKIRVAEQDKDFS